MADNPEDGQGPEAVEGGEKEAEAEAETGSSEKPQDGESSAAEENQTTATESKKALGESEAQPEVAETEVQPEVAESKKTLGESEIQPEVAESKTLGESEAQPEVAESKKTLAEPEAQPEGTESKKALPESAEESSKVESKILTEMDNEEAMEMEEELDEEATGVVLTIEIAEGAKLPSQLDIETSGSKPPSPKESLSDFTKYTPGFDAESHAEEEQEEEEEEEEEVPMEPIVPYRDRLIIAYKSAKIEQKKLHDLNRKLQHKLSVILSKKERELTVLTEDETAELEMQYIMLMTSLDEMQMQQEQLKEYQMYETEELKLESQEEQAAAEAQLTKLLNYRKNAATGGIRNKKSSRYKRAEQYFHAEREKRTEASKITLENILIKEENDRVMKILKERERVAEGLTMADFEQLKIENQSCNEKIEETNETIGQVRRKLREAIQRLTHVKQKLNFENIETRHLREALEEVEDRVLVRRQILHSTKIARDRLKRNSKNLKQKSALLCFPELLHDYRMKLDEIDDLRTKLAELKISHKDMTKEIRNLQYKIQDLKFIAQKA